MSNPIVQIAPLKPGTTEIPNHCWAGRQAIERLDIYGFADSIESHNELRAGKQLIFKAEVNLVDGSKLIVREYIDAK